MEFDSIETGLASHTFEIRLRNRPGKFHVTRERGHCCCVVFDCIEAGNVWNGILPSTSSGWIAPCSSNRSSCPCQRQQTYSESESEVNQHWKIFEHRNEQLLMVIALMTRHLGTDSCRLFKGLHKSAKSTIRKLFADFFHQMHTFCSFCILYWCASHCHAWASSRWG